MSNHLTKDQAVTLACIVNYFINNGGVPSNNKLGILLKINSEAARKRKKGLIDKEYLLPIEGKGLYEINKDLFCTTPLTARFLLLFRRMKKDGFVNENELLKISTDTIFTGKKEHAISTLKSCLNFGYLSRHQGRDSQIEEGRYLYQHYEYLLLIK